MRYQDLVSELEVDGSLRDIYVLGTTVADWNCLLNLSTSLAEIEYFCDGEQVPLPSSANSIFGDDYHSHLLRFRLGGPIINTHFFISDEIELDFDPREITSQADLELVLNFCASIARELERDIKITPENLSEITYLHFSFEEDAWRKPKRP